MPTVNERLTTLEAKFDAHQEHCATDKADIKADIRGVNGKLWALIAAAVIQLLAMVAYLTTEGPPWMSQAVAQETE